MAISRGNVTSVDYGGSPSFSHNNNGLMVIVWVRDDSNAATGATYGGVTMLAGPTATVSGFPHKSYYLDNAPSGANTLAIGGIVNGSFVAVSYLNGAFRNSNSTSDNANNPAGCTLTGLATTDWATGLFADRSGTDPSFTTGTAYATPGGGASMVAGDSNGTVGATSYTLAVGRQTGNIACLVIGIQQGSPSVTPGVGSISITGAAPSLKLQVGAPVGSLAISTTTPVPTYTGFVGVGTITATGYAPVITNSRTVSPTIGSIAFSGTAPAIQLAIGVPAGALALTGQTPAVQDKDQVPPGELLITGYAPLVEIDTRANPGVGALSFTGYAPSCAFSYTNPAHMWLLENDSIVDPLDGTIQEYADETPNRMSFRCRLTRPTEGDAIYAYLGSPYNNADRKFGGFIVNVQTVDGAQAGSDQQTFTATCADFAWPLQVGPKVNKVYTGQTGNFIAADLIAMIPGYTGNAVQAGLATIPSIVFKNLSVMDCLKQLRDYLNTLYLSDVHLKVDYFKDVHLTVGADASIPTPVQIDASHPTLTNFTWVKDIQPLVTRAVTSGDGSTSVGPANPGDTVLPLLDASMFQDTGGYVEVAGGTQRLSYTGRQIAVGGSLVGTGIGPGAAPAAAIASGAGVDSGAHTYGVLFRTTSDAALSLMSPLIAVTTGHFSAPSTAPTLAGPTVGAGPDTGTHSYKLTFGDSVGETDAGVVSANVTTVDGAVASSAPSAANVNDGVGHVISGLGWALGDTVAFKYGYSIAAAFDDQNITGLSSASSPLTLVQAPGFPAGDAESVRVTVPNSTDANIKFIAVYCSHNGGPFNFFITGTLTNNTSGGSQQCNLFDGSVNGSNAPGAFSKAIHTVSLSAISLGPTGITSRKIYRTAAGGSQYKLVATIADNTTTTFSDTVTDAALGANIPTSNTTQANQVALSGIATGSATVTERWLYRTVAGGTQLKFLAKISDNTTTVYTDSIADASLGANAPTGDTSGLSGPVGQVLAGSTSMQVAGAGWASSTGGRAACNGMVIRYTGVTGNTLTGIPSTGTGAITASINFNSTITGTSTLTGIPASGTGSIQYVINKGDAINLISIRDDLNAQASLAAALNRDGHTPPSDGVFEDYVSLGAGVPQAACDQNGDARLAESATAVITASWSSQDPTTTAGATVSISRSDLVASVTLQQVQISRWNRQALYTERDDSIDHTKEYPLYTVSQAGNQRVALDKFVRDMERPA